MKVNQERSNKKVLFVGRHNNDIDWISPVVNQGIENGWNCYYFIATPYIEISKDFRLSYLRAKSCNIFGVFDVYKNPITRILFSLKRVKASRMLLDKILYRRIDEKKMRNLLRNINPSIIVFDHTCRILETKSNTRPPFGLDHIFSWAEDMNIPCLSLPHGLIFFDLVRKGTYNCFNHYKQVFSANDLQTKFLHKGGVEPSKIILGGASRFDAYWLKTLDEILPRNTLIDKKINNYYTIVFFATKMVYDYDFKGLINWLKILAEDKEIFLIVQPHPRGQKKKSFKELFNLDNVIIDDSTPSSLLIRYGDCVSTLVSSVVTEAVCLNKPILYPKFLHKKDTVFDDGDVSLILNDVSDTKKALSSLKREEFKPKNDKFLAKYVYPKTKFTAQYIWRNIVENHKTL